MSTTVTTSPEHSLFYHKLLLAPMVRVGLLGFRVGCRRHGADVLFTEEVVAAKLRGCQREEVTYPHVGTVIEYVTYELFRKQYKRTVVFSTCAADRPVVLQLGAADPAVAAAAAVVCCDDVDGIDLNMGCPKKFSICNGFGAALMSDPARGGQIVGAIHEAVNSPTRVAARSGRVVPVSFKTRLRDSVEETVAMLRAVLTAAGHTAERPVVHAITLHARERDHRPEEVPLYERAAAVVQACRVDTLFGSVCFVLNGSIASRRDGEAKMRQYGFDSAMLARAALADMRAFERTTATPDHKNDTPTEASMYELLRELFTLAVQYRCAFKNFKYHLTRLYPAVNCLKDKMPLVQSQLRTYQDGYKMFRVEEAEQRMLEECVYEVEMLDTLPEDKEEKGEPEAKKIRSE